MGFPLLKKQIETAYDLRLPMSLTINFDGEGNHKIEISKLGDKASNALLSLDNIAKKITSLINSQNDEKEEK